MKGEDITKEYNKKTPKHKSKLMWENTERTDAVYERQQNQFL